MRLQIDVFLVMTPRSVAVGCLHFGGPPCLHVPGVGVMSTWIFIMWIPQISLQQCILSCTLHVWRKRWVKRNIVDFPGTRESANSRRCQSGRLCKNSMWGSVQQ